MRLVFFQTKTLCNLYPNMYPFFSWLSRSNTNFSSCVGTTQWGGQVLFFAISISEPSGLSWHRLIREPQRHWKPFAWMKLFCKRNVKCWGQTLFFHNFYFHNLPLIETIMKTIPQKRGGTIPLIGWSFVYFRSVNKTNIPKIMNKIPSIPAKTLKTVLTGAFHLMSNRAIAIIPLAIVHTEEILPHQMKLG